MTHPPLLSYIVLSYNYEMYIGATIRSILQQTVQDFEIVVVDDASRDQSREIVSAFGDPRIHLLTNERNMGGAWSYNRAVTAARGEWLVNLDADDWIAPRKAEIQMEALAADPELDIIGTYVTLLDAKGDPHPQASELETNCNAALDLNTIDPWVGRNPLCRSSTMVRRAAHLRIGLDDPAMVRAPDYELWTRALREGCRFAVIPERLTFLRLQPGSVTFGDPTGTLLEISYAMLRNLVPLAEDRALLPSLQRMIEWVARHEQLSALPPVEACRLLGMMMIGSPPTGDFSTFRAALSDPQSDPALARLGRRCQVFLRGDMIGGDTTEKLLCDVEAYIEARDYWQHQAEAYIEARDYWQRQAEALTEARDDWQRQAEEASESCNRWREQSDGWERAYRRTLRWKLGRLARKAYSRFFRSS